jgi:hypothetical protein
MDDEKRVNEPTAAYSTSAYNDVLGRIQRLTPVDQLRLLEELALLARHLVTSQTHRSILEIQGLGKEIWQGMDAKEYIDQERASWNG